MIAAIKGKIGAIVSDGGNGVFPADIIRVGDCFVIVANPKLGGIAYNSAAKPTHEFVCVPQRTYENKERGFFVVPVGQLYEVKR